MARGISIPNPFDSDKEYTRYCHCDLADMTTEDLLCELCAVRCQLWLIKSNRFGRLLNPFERHKKTQWLQERVSKIKVELSKREYAKRETRSEPRPKTKMAEGVTL